MLMKALVGGLKILNAQTTKPETVMPSASEDPGIKLAAGVEGDWSAACDI
jgi:hypothetical protein